MEISRPRPKRLREVTYLTPGQRYEGRQKVSSDAWLVSTGSKDKDEWRVNVLIQGVDLERGTVHGTMEALDVPKAESPVVTFWRGEIVDNVNSFFWTRRWNARPKQDLDHWCKFLAFTKYEERVREYGGNDIDLSESRYVFMRWKEVYFLNVREDCRLTIAGFYYLCLDRQAGDIRGFYYDPQTSPYQKLFLEPLNGIGGRGSCACAFN